MNPTMPLSMILLLLLSTLGMITASAIPSISTPSEIEALQQMSNLGVNPFTLSYLTENNITFPTPVETISTVANSKLLVEKRYFRQAPWCDYIADRGMCTLAIFQAKTNKTSATSLFAYDHKCALVGHRIAIPYHTEVMGRLPYVIVFDYTRLLEWRYANGWFSVVNPQGLIFNSKTCYIDHQDDGSRSTIYICRFGCSAGGWQGA